MMLASDGYVRPVAHGDRVGRGNTGVLVTVVRVGERDRTDRVRERRQRMRRVVDREVPAAVVRPVGDVQHVRGERRVAGRGLRIVSDLAALDQELPVVRNVGLQCRPVGRYRHGRRVVARGRDDEVVVREPRGGVGRRRSLLRDVVAQGLEVRTDLRCGIQVVGDTAPRLDQRAVLGALVVGSPVHAIRDDQDVAQGHFEHEVLGHRWRADGDAAILGDVVIRAHVHLVVEVRKRHGVVARHRIGRRLGVELHVSVRKTLTVASRGVPVPTSVTVPDTSPDGAKSR